MDGPTVTTTLNRDHFHARREPLSALHPHNAPNVHRSPSGRQLHISQEHLKSIRPLAPDEAPSKLPSPVEHRPETLEKEPPEQDPDPGIQNDIAALDAPHLTPRRPLDGPRQTAEPNSTADAVASLARQTRDTEPLEDHGESTGASPYSEASQTATSKNPQDAASTLTFSTTLAPSLPSAAYPPDSLPPTPQLHVHPPGGLDEDVFAATEAETLPDDTLGSSEAPNSTAALATNDGDTKRRREPTVDMDDRDVFLTANPELRPRLPPRATSTPSLVRNAPSPRKIAKVRPTLKVRDSGLHGAGHDRGHHASMAQPLPSPMPSSIPLPPLSVPTYLQLELSSQRPSRLYLHRSANSDFPYESSRVKLERLVNFLLLPPHLEGVLWFGILACLDSWLYTFTILPLRLVKSLYILAKSWSARAMSEVHFVSSFVYNGTGRMWRRRGRSLASTSSRSATTPDGKAAENGGPGAAPADRKTPRHHHRTRSVPSNLLPDDKADMLKGLLIICTCLVLLRLDASRMYHWIRGQAAIKLYVIYNLLEVCDRLFSAIGQDVLECLFSREALERKPDGHSKVWRPFWLFVLALVYTVIHSTALFYQVITLNVAVNSYSNALITLLLSNQFVEIKGTVFKKFEKENLFQLTCADIVERFQLWHMLVIIASRNIVETGGLSAGLSALTASSSSSTATAALGSNSSAPLSAALPPKSASSIVPRSFTLVPVVVNSITSFAPVVGQVLGPFLVVLGSEMLVDWLKHAYINKFNNTRPAIYDRFLDVLAKDYYMNAFGDQNLTKRLGLPVIPLSCLLIRASVQTYQMFMAAWVPPAPTTPAASLASIHEQYSAARATRPMTTGAAISQTVDAMIKAIPTVITGSSLASHLTFVLVFLLLFALLLACKLVLGMLLLAFARSRYHSMKMREKTPIHHVEGGRRIGGWGVVEVDEDKRRWIYDDDPAGARALREREERETLKHHRDREKGHGIDSFEKIKRYEMVAKRIW